MSTIGLIPLSGTGSPDGVVTAYVGQVYVQTDAPFGLWQKTDGADEFGWTIVGVSGVFDVRSYGAVADCTGPGTGTDSRAAIQAALDAASAVGGVVTGIGRYRVSNTLYFYPAAGTSYTGYGRIKLSGSNAARYTQSNTDTTGFQLIFDDGVAGYCLEAANTTGSVNNDVRYLTISDMLIVTGDQSLAAIRLQRATDRWRIDNVDARVRNPAGHFVDLLNCWSGSLTDLRCFGEADGAGTATGAGLRVNAQAAVDGGGTCNQLVISNVDFYSMGYGFDIGSHDDQTLNLKSAIAILAGQSSHADQNGVYCGRGVRALSFLGFHIESSYRDGLLCEYGASGVSFRDGTFNNNGIDGTSYDVHIGGSTKDTSNIEVVNSFHSNCNRGFRVQLGSAMGKTFLSRNRLAPKTNGVGTGTFLDGAAHNDTQVIVLDDQETIGANVFATALDDVRLMATRPVRDNAYKLFNAGETTLDMTGLHVADLNNSGAVSVTDIVAGYHGQMITLFFGNVNTTLLNNAGAAGTSIFLSNSLDYTPSNANECKRLTYSRDAGGAAVGAWVEVRPHVAAANVYAGTFASGDFVFPAKLTVTTAFGCNAKTAQTAATANAAVVTTAATQTTPYGYVTQAQADNLVTLLNQVRAALVANGIMV